MESETQSEEGKAEEEERRAKLRLFRWVRCGCVQGDLGCDPLLFYLLSLFPFPRQDVSEPKSPRVVVNKIDEALRREPIKTKNLSLNDNNQQNIKR